MKIINPYEGIDFATAKVVKSISHEHIASGVEWQNAYDRGIRHFPTVSYQPSVPRFPASNFYCRIVSGQEVYIEYKDWESVPNGVFVLENKILKGGIDAFDDSNGNTIKTDDLPQVPNNEHPEFTKDLRTTTYSLSHFNVLGNMWGEAGHGLNNGTPAQREGHPIHDLSETSNFLLADNQYWKGKAFVTINHCESVTAAEELIKSSLGQLPMGYELFNQSRSRLRNQQIRNTYDKLLRKGFRLYALAVVDWQGVIEIRRTSEEEKANDYIFDATEDRGCNVLYVPNNYDELPANDFIKYNDKSYPNLHGNVYTKAEAGLDCYITGKFFASGLGNHRITNLSITGRKVTFSVDGNPTILKAITSKGEKIVSANNIEISIGIGVTYVRFEAYYDNDVIRDFIFTQPIYIEENNKDDVAQRLLLL